MTLTKKNNVSLSVSHTDAHTHAYRHRHTDTQTVEKVFRSLKHKRFLLIISVESYAKKYFVSSKEGTYHFKTQTTHAIIEGELSE